MKAKKTELGKSYWDSNGAYQSEYDELYNELVPDRGEADSQEGEMLRSISRLYYDFCNNGNGNVFEESWGEVTMNPMYEEFVDNLIDGLLDNKSINKLKDFLDTPAACNPDFTEDQMNLYDSVIDEVVCQILTERELS